MRGLLPRAGIVLLAIAGCSKNPAPAPAPAPQPTAGVAQRPAGETSETPTQGAGRGNFPGRSGGQGGDQQADAQPRPYARVVTSEAQTRTGLFKTHRIGARLLFEIPRNQLG